MPAMMTRHTAILAVVVADGEHVKGLVETELTPTES